MNELETGNIVGDAVQRTGPLPFTLAIWNYLKQSPSSFTITKKEILYLKDIKILGVDFMDTSWAKHFYAGSWKIGAKEDRINKATEKILQLSLDWKRGVLKF